MAKPHLIVGRLAISRTHVKFLKFFKGRIKEPVSDAERLAAYKAGGDVSVLGALYEPYMDMIFGVCYQYLRDEAESKDAVMQIFEKLVVDLRHHEVSNFKSWLHTVARNHCLMKLRAAKVTASHGLSDETEQEIHQEVTTDDNMFDIEGRLDTLDECLQKLANEQRISIELFYLQDKCYRDIAVETGFEMSKVKSYIQNGKRKLKICIENNGSN